MYSVTQFDFTNDCLSIDHFCLQSFNYMYSLSQYITELVFSQLVSQTGRHIYLYSIMQSDFTDGCLLRLFLIFL